MKAILKRVITRRVLFVCLSIILIVPAILTGYGKDQTNEEQATPHSSSVVQEQDQSLIQPSGSDDEPLINSDLGLAEGPVDVPLKLLIPSIQVSAPVLGVGITAKNVMDAPKGPANDPMWQTAFWYRGSGEPGELSTSTMAGHVDDALGRPAVFARLKELRTSDQIIVLNTSSGSEMVYIVRKSETYSMQQSADPSLLAQIYGSGPVSGKGPQPSEDGLSHLTLITCSGDYVNGSYDHRLVVYATKETG